MIKLFSAIGHCATVFLISLGCLSEHGVNSSPTSRPSNESGVELALYYDNTTISGSSVPVVIELVNKGSGALMVWPALRVETEVIPPFGVKSAPRVFERKYAGGKTATVVLHLRFIDDIGESRFGLLETIWLGENHDQDIQIGSGEEVLRKIQLPSRIFEKGRTIVSATLMLDDRSVATSEQMILSQ